MAKEKHDFCIVCGSDNLELVLDLNNQPPANCLLSSADKKYNVYPLGLNKCNECLHGQLNYFVNPAELFSDYLYVSGTSNTLRKYFEWYVDDLNKTWKGGKTLMEIGCNDGTLLSTFARGGWKAFGVDPAKNIVEKISDPNIKVKNAFWPCDLSGFPDKYDVIVAQNVFAHNPAPYDFLLGIKDVMHDDSIAIIQTSQALMLEQGDFDTIYHEHYSLFTGNSMRALAKRAGLHIIAESFADIHGMSAVYVLSKKPENKLLAKDALLSAPFGVRSEKEKAWFFDYGAEELHKQYDNFARAAKARIKEVQDIITKKKAAGYQICLVGAAAKAITFMRAASIEADSVVDEAVQKIGLYIAGMNFPIKALKEVADMPEKTLFVISAWNFYKELKEKVAAARPGKKSEFLVYFPEVKFEEK